MLIEYGQMLHRRGSSPAEVFHRGFDEWVRRLRSTDPVDQMKDLPEFGIGQREVAAPRTADPEAQPPEAQPMEAQPMERTQESCRWQDDGGESGEDV